MAIGQVAIGFRIDAYAFQLFLNLIGDLPGGKLEIDITRIVGAERHSHLA